MLKRLLINNKLLFIQLHFNSVVLSSFLTLLTLYSSIIWSTCLVHVNLCFSFTIRVNIALFFFYKFQDHSFILHYILYFFKTANCYFVFSISFHFTSISFTFNFVHLFYHFAPFMLNHLKYCILFVNSVKIILHYILIITRPM